MPYKKQFTEAELKELLEWFEAQAEHLPHSLQLDKATYIADLPKTVKLYFDIVRLHGDNPTYSGQINHLFKIKEKLAAAQ
ncbi:MAG: DUF6965 family protein [Alloprevotella sp.]